MCAQQMKTAAARLSGKRRHIDTTVENKCLNPGLLDDVLEAVGAPTEPARDNAAAFLLPNVLRPRNSVLLNAALSGSVLFSPSSMVLGTGPRVGYHRALSRRRTIWFSVEFRHLHPKIARAFVARMGERPHRWIGVTNQETFAQRAQRNKRAKTMCLRVVSKHKLRDEDAQSAKLLTATMALSFLADMDRCKTNTGMCAK